HSPGLLGAATEDMKNEAKLRGIEQQRVQGRLPLDYEPGFFPWCDEYTPDERLVARVRRELLRGNHQPYEDARKHGFEFSIDFANGSVNAVYALCMRKNPDGHCKAWISREWATA